MAPAILGAVPDGPGPPGVGSLSHLPLPGAPRPLRAHPAARAALAVRAHPAVRAALAAVAARAAVGPAAPEPVPPRAALLPARLPAADP